MIRELGGLVVHVRRPDASTVNSHISEAGVPFGRGDMEIDNKGSLSDLQGSARLLLD